jgi:threonine/homoserine/homoserine lactone efflux protein
MVIHFIFGLLGSFLGGVALGPINLSVVDLTLKRNIHSALRFSAAAAVVEIFQAAIAVTFGKLISRKIDEVPELQLLIVAFFAILGIFFLYKKDNKRKERNKTTNASTVVNGFVIAILNPQTIPYWIFVLAYLKAANVLYLNTWHLIIFLAGVSIGKFTILSLYGFLSESVQNHFENLNSSVSKIIGGLLLGIGLAQAIRYFFF